MSHVHYHTILHLSLSFFSTFRRKFVKVIGFCAQAFRSFSLSVVLIPAGSQAPSPNHSRLVVQRQSWSIVDHFMNETKLLYSIFNPFSIGCFFFHMLVCVHACIHITYIHMYILCHVLPYFAIVFFRWVFGGKKPCSEALLLQPSGIHPAMPRPVSCA